MENWLSGEIDERYPNALAFLEYFVSTKDAKATGSVYFAGYGDRVKIGFTRNLPARMKMLQTMCPEPMKFHWGFDGTRGAETAAHKIFASKRLCGEWFEIDEEMRAFLTAVRKDTYQNNLKNWAAGTWEATIPTYSQTRDEVKSRRKERVIPL